MTSPEQNTNQETTPIIPSWLLLSIAGVSLLIFLVSLVLSGQSVVQLGSGAITLIVLGVWAFMFPQDLLDFLKGRSFRFGAVGIGVVAMLFVAAGLIYAVIKSRNLSYDFSERNIYTLDEQVRDVLQRMSQDPTVPSVYVLGFYTVTQASERDLIEVLLNDMVSASGGKIVDYQFIDPNVEPLRAQTYLATDATAGSTPRTPAIVITTLDPETGAPSTTDFEPVSLGFQLDVSPQYSIVNTILQLGTTGDFRAYFLGVDGSIDINSTGALGADGFKGDLEDSGWTVEQINPLAIAGNPPTVILNDPTANAEILILAGGTVPLTDEALAAIQTYASNGGDIIVMGDINPDGSATTAQVENFSNFLWENYGVRLRTDLVLDPDKGYRNTYGFYANNFETHPITTGFDENSAVVFESAHSIEVSDTPPTGVTVTVLLSTGENAYAKANFDFTGQVTSDSLQRTDSDLSGEIPLAVAVENSTTGSRLVLISSDVPLINADRRVGGVVSPEFVEAGVTWASNATNFASTLERLIPEPNEADSPVFVSESNLSLMGLIALGVLPLGMLGLGILVWLSQRPRSE